MDHVGEIKGKAGESLREHLDGVLRNRRLNQLLFDLELPTSVDALERQAWDREQVHTVFDGLEFRVLRDRLFATLESAEPEATDSVEVDGVVLAPAEVAGWLAEIPAGTRCGLQVLGQWARGTGDAQAVAIAPADRADAAYIDLESLDADGEQTLAAWLADTDRPKALHDAKGPMQALIARGLPLRGVQCDTALAAYLVHPDQRSYDLADLVLRALHRELTGAQDDSAQGVLDLGVGDQRADDAMATARAVLDLSVHLDEELESIGESGLLRDVELPLVGVLAAMERAGIGSDGHAMETLERDYGDGVASAAADAYAAIGGEKINLGSPKQLQVVLFEQLGMPKTKRTKTGYTTDADALADLYAKTEHPFLEALLRHRDSSRLRVTVEGLLKSVADDGRIHTTYQQTIAATGRLSSTDPNLQNIPIRTEAGRRIREVFVVGTGYETLMSADYSQIEMRIMAHLSGDEGLIEAFRTGEDLHRFVGSRVFRVEPADVSNEMRAKVKAMSYGLAYGVVGVRAVQTADHRHRRGQGPDG